MADPMPWERPGPSPKEQKLATDIQSGQKSLVETGLDIGAKAAKAPYIAEDAAASVQNLQLRNVDLQRQLDKARKGEPLQGDDKTKFDTDVDAYARLDNAIKSYNPDFSGTILDFPGEAENAIQRRVSGEFGTPDQAKFWQEMHLLDMMVRNKYFGASLTPAEKASYSETTITPGMQPDLSLQNLISRRDLLGAGIQRRVNSLRAGGYNPAQINASLGEYVPTLNPRWLSPENERTLGAYASSKDFDPAVYQQMLLQFGDANGVRIDPEGAAAAAQTVADTRAKGDVKFSGTAVYQGLTAPTQKLDESGAALAPAGQGPTGGGGQGPTGGAGGGGGGDGLGWGETLGGAAVNLVPSTYREIKGIGEAIADPVGTATTVAQLGGGLLSMMGVGDFDQSTARALGQYYANKYGSMEGFKKELSENPASVLGDVAVVFSGGAAGAAKVGIPAKLTTQIARMGPTATKVATFAAEAAKNVDPITALTNIVAKGAPAAARVAGTAAGRVASGAFGTSTGGGADAVREAAKVGFGRSVAGAPTEASDAFLSAMRNPGTSTDDLVKLAQEGVANLRQQASQRYTDAMARFGRNPVPLDIGNVQRRMLNIKPKSYDTWVGTKGPRPSDHQAWETMNQFVEDYAAKSAADPSLLAPLAMDQFKQDLYDVGSKVGGAYDRDAARIAGTAYRGVKDELIKHDPVYANTMKDYERAANEAKQLETTFGLAAARGKTPNLESAGRKLTSIFRNNVNTNYGGRTEQARRLTELDPSGRLFPSLAGQSLSSWLPRGIQGGIARAGAGAGITGMALDALPMALDVPGYLSGYNLAALPASSPRLIGEAAYYGGRGAGAASSALEPLTSRLGSGVDWLAQKQAQYRAPLMGAGVVGMNVNAMQNPELQQLLDQYAAENGPR